MFYSGILTDFLRLIVKEKSPIIIHLFKIIAIFQYKECHAFIQFQNEPHLFTRPFAQHFLYVYDGQVLRSAFRI